MAATQTSSTPSAFGGLLKSWRATRKQSQLNLALGAGVSQRHVSFLESGRAHPSRPMVMQLAEALDVPLRDRNALLSAAGFAAYYRERPLDDATMSPVRDALTRTLDHHAPYPALVLDREYNILMENSGFTGLLGLFSDPEQLWQACCPTGPRNLLRLMFHPQGARALIKNFEEIAPLILQRSMREAPDPDSPVYQFLLALRADDTLPAAWHLPDPMRVPAPVMPLILGQGDIALSLFSMIATFGTPHDVTTDEIRVETFFPADVATEDFLIELSKA